MGRFQPLLRLSVAASFGLCAIGSFSTACSSEFGRSASDEADAGADVAVIDGGPDGEPYPAPPYGFSVGNTVPNLILQTRIPPSTEWTYVPLSTYFDPFGRKGIKAIAIEVNKAGDVLTDQAIAQLVGRAPLYADRGARLMEVLLPGADPATREIGDAFITKHAITFPVLLDPEKNINVDVAPFRMFIDPRVMQIRKTTTGIGPAGYQFAPELDEILQANGVKL